MFRIHRETFVRPSRLRRASVPILAVGFLASAALSFSASSGSAARSRRPSVPGTLRPSSPLSAGNFNPFSSLFDGIASNVMPSSGGAVDQKEAFGASSVPSWESISGDLAAAQTPSEREFRGNLAKGLGSPSPLHDLRLYDAARFSESDVRVTFYRDSASWCPYCQKVWLMLEEKGIPYRVERINMRCYGDKPRSFARLQPSGAIPVATIDGVTYRQSNDIMYKLEESFTEADGYRSVGWDKAETDDARRLLRLERGLFSAWMNWLTGGDYGGMAQKSFVKALDEVERELARNGGGFFVGGRPTIVDFMYASFLERMAASLLYFKGFRFRHDPATRAGGDTSYPALNAWFDAMETLPSYRVTKSDYYTHCWDLPPQLGGCVPEKGGAPFTAAINGERRLDGTGGSWDLPLQPHNGGAEPDWDWCGDDAAARREAVERLSANRAAIVRFAARGAGKAGIPGVMAPLSDPGAKPDELVGPAVDGALRAVCAAMLEGKGTATGAVAEAAAVVRGGGKGHTDAVVRSLAYLRDRVGVPRDMRLPAARQLRAHLNLVIGEIIRD